MLAKSPEWPGRCDLMVVASSLVVEGKEVQPVLLLVCLLQQMLPLSTQVRAPLVESCKPKLKALCQACPIETLSLSRPPKVG